MSGHLHIPRQTQQAVMMLRLCRYFLKPRQQLMEALDAAQSTGDSEIHQLQEQGKAIAKARKEVEGELRELLQHSPALVRSLQNA